MEMARAVRSILRRERADKMTACSPAKICERKGVPSEGGGGSSGGGQAGISYLQLATLGLSGRFSSGNISLHCPPRGDDVGIPVRMAVCRTNVVSVDWLSLNGKKKKLTNLSLWKYAR